MLDRSISKVTGGDKSLLQFCESSPEVCVVSEAETHLERAAFQNNIVQSYKERVMKRRQRKMVPSDRKDEAYWLRRFKNNEAAKISRKRRRLSDMAIRFQLQALMSENAVLKSDLCSMKSRFEYAHRLYASLLEQRSQDERDKALLKSILTFSERGDRSPISDNLFPSCRRVDPIIDTALPHNITTRNDRAFHTMLMMDTSTVPVTSCQPPSVEPVIASFLGRESKSILESYYRPFTPMKAVEGFSQRCKYGHIPSTPDTSQQIIIPSQQEFHHPLSGKANSGHVNERSEVKETGFFGSMNETSGNEFAFHNEQKLGTIKVGCAKPPTTEDRNHRYPQEMNTYSAACRYGIPNSEISQDDKRGIKDIHKGVEWNSGMNGLPVKLRAKKSRPMSTISPTSELREKSGNNFDTDRDEEAGTRDNACQPIDLSLQVRLAPK